MEKIHDNRQTVFTVCLFIFIETFKTLIIMPFIILFAVCALVSLTYFIVGTLVFFNSIKDLPTEEKRLLYHKALAIWNAIGWPITGLFILIDFTLNRKNYDHAERARQKRLEESSIPNQRDAKSVSTMQN